jgi:rRNA maturation endonuclease Nob1
MFRFDKVGAHLLTLCPDHHKELKNSFKSKMNMHSVYTCHGCDKSVEAYFIPAQLCSTCSRDHWQCAVCRKKSPSLPI